MNEKFLKPYNPQETEGRIYKLWETSGYFNPDKLPADHKDPYTIMMPPPNVTGVLHMGHAMMITIEDIMIRYKRMRGYKTLWLPGTDHAAIATQSRVEKDIKKAEDKSRYDLGREELLRRIDAFAKQSHDTIISQLKVFGASCDWSREAFTLDEKRNLAVRTIFKKMYDDGLIYRGNRIVNWDPKGQTTISDDEIVYEERDAKFYTFKYSKDFPISISTTRPETKVGDTAVAVHPDDLRYQKYIGKEYDAVFCGVPIHIKIIADKSVEKDFGTGALGVTPAHSKIDWEMGEKNHLPIIQVIDEKARMMVGDERLMGKKVTEAREVIVEWLKSEGLLEKEETIKQNVSTAERTGGIVEPLPKLQWFVAVDKKFNIEKKNNSGMFPTGMKEASLKDILWHAVKPNQINIIPEYFSKTYFHWTEKLNDWCISRQIWYGHRIPVWYKGEQIYCGTEAPKGDGWTQDEDTLDTWFSSALWTFSTLGWPEQTKDLAMYHPTDVLETGYEIIFFWVARMIMMTGYALGTIPFKTVYLHGTVRDAKGRKMSKSLGNGIDPLDIAAKFGADAGRMALVVGNAPGTDSKISEDKIKGYKNFSNKVWNIARFIQEGTAGTAYDPKFTSFTPDEEHAREERRAFIADMTRDMEEFRFYMASEKIYHYVWHTLADVILEDSKKIFKDGAEEAKISRKQFLLETLEICLKLLHPFMPFLTEEIWQLTGKRNLLMIETWPIAKETDA
ncbi:MAG: valine--tRNA ligase [Patescibacteria group bacterium]|nr:valine--tRNA ligase [Patescibacteria group bacterium]MDE1946083.1 valine--tRNA ligase [Patescibacteria group bacterium]